MGHSPLASIGLARGWHDCRSPLTSRTILMKSLASPEAIVVGPVRMLPISVGVSRRRKVNAFSYIERRFNVNGTGRSAARAS